MKTLNENSNVAVEGHVLIKDFDSGEVLLDKYNAINFQNFAFAVAHALGGDGTTYGISKLALGMGGSTVEANGSVTYKQPKVSGATGQLYTACKDNSGASSVDLTVPVTFVVNNASNQPYSDLECRAVLDYDFPADAQAVDNSPTMDEISDTNFIFDEIGLMTGSTTGEGSFLTHLIFHPIQKSKNRKLEILYTLRIRAGV
jgi:hypothetical protein